MMSLPSCFFRLLISSKRSPFAKTVLSHSDLSSVLVNTTFLKLLSLSALSCWALEAQYEMNKWWVPGLSIGYEHSFVHQVADFLKSLETGEPCAPTFKDALETQKVCEAVIESGASRSWKEVGKVGK